ncbi:Angio-associated migratory cell protein [Zootermopsis nevadensis]|uniref:Angio-associated migratory cell protein n=1 Tax=Zootermopsis nevadensis TaxID=136037 RepID=A0A067RC01_ZOONE|nr:Angio-associated migratory cell protein [Zootermopsis nevadensis]
MDVMERGCEEGRWMKIAQNTFKMLSQESDWLRTRRPGFDPRQGHRIFPLASASRPALGPTQNPIQWVPGSFPGGKARPGSHDLLGRELTKQIQEKFEAKFGDFNARASDELCTSVGLTDGWIQQVSSYFSTYSPPELRHLSYRGTNFGIPVDGEAASSNNYIEANDASDEDIGIGLEGSENSEGNNPVRDDSASVFSHHKGSVFCCHLQPKAGRLAVTGAEDDMAYVWETHSGEVVLQCKGHKDSVTCVRFNYDGSYVATGDMSGVIQVWKIANKLQVWETCIGDLTWLRWHHGANVLLAGTESGEVYVWRIPGGECKVLPGHGDKADCGLMLPDGKRMAIGYADGSLKIFDTKTATVLHHVPQGQAHTGTITDMDCHPDNNLLISSSVDGHAVVLKTQTGKFHSVKVMERSSQGVKAEGNGGLFYVSLGHTDRGSSQCLHERRPVTTEAGFGGKAVGIRKSSSVEFQRGSSEYPLGPTQPPIQWVPGSFPGGKAGRGVILTTHPYLVPRSRKRGAIHPHPPSAYMAYSVTNDKMRFESRQVHLSTCTPLDERLNRRTMQPCAHDVDRSSDYFASLPMRDDASKTPRKNWGKLHPRFPDPQKDLPNIKREKLFSVQGPQDVETAMPRVGFEPAIEVSEQLM